MSNELAIDRGKRLAELEALMQDSRTEFESGFAFTRRHLLNYGKALKEIKDSQLYEVKHGTWVEYVEQSLGISRQWANKLIAATSHPPTTLSLPVSVVADLPNDPVDSREVVEKAEVLAEERGLEAPRREEVRDATKIVAATQGDDDSEDDHVTLPETVVKALIEARRLRAIANDINQAIKKVQEASEETVGRFLPTQQISADLRNASNAIKYASPYAPCVYCGMKGMGCSACNPESSEDPQLWITLMAFKQAPDSLVAGAREAGLLEGIKVPVK